MQRSKTVRFPSPGFPAGLASILTGVGMLLAGNPGLLARADLPPPDSLVFFRLAAPGGTRHLGLNHDGRVILTNEVVGVTGRVLRATGEIGNAQWVDYLQYRITNAVMTIRLCDFAPPDGMTFIPAGMNTGTVPGFGAYSVEVEAPFYMDRAHVTRAHWEDVRAWGLTNGYTDLPAATSSGNSQRPVEFVSWHDAVKWCNARSESEGRPVAYRLKGEVYRMGVDETVHVEPLPGSYRLPTRIEWEFAARGGLRGKLYPWGDDIDSTRLNYRGIVDATTVAGTYPANGYDLFDMAGNLTQWIQDWRPGFEGEYRLLKGGSWQSSAEECVIHRNGFGTTWYGLYEVGFRAVMTAPPLDE